MTIKVFQPVTSPLLPSYFALATDCPACGALSGVSCLVRDDNLIRVHEQRANLNALMQDAYLSVQAEAERIEQEIQLMAEAAVREAEFVLRQEQQKEDVRRLARERYARRRQIQKRREETLRAGRNPDVPRATVPGLYMDPQTGKWFEVKRTKQGRLVAKRECASGRYVYERGLIYDIDPAWFVSP